LLTEEQEQDAIVEIRELVDYNDDMQQLIEESTAAMGLPYGLLAQIKMNLNIDRDIHTEIKLAIEEYNTAICRELTDRMRDKFPRELRDMVYRYLVPDTVNICTDEEYSPGRAVKLYHNRITRTSHPIHAPWTITSTLSTSGVARLSPSTWHMSLQSAFTESQTSI
jgi:hypothetical protein